MSSGGICQEVLLISVNGRGRWRVVRVLECIAACSPDRQKERKKEIKGKKENLRPDECASEISPPSPAAAAAAASSSASCRVLNLEEGAFSLVAPPHLSFIIIFFCDFIFCFICTLYGTYFCMSCPVEVSTRVAVKWTWNDIDSRPDELLHGAASQYWLDPSALQSVGCCRRQRGVNKLTAVTATGCCWFHCAPPLQLTFAGSFFPRPFARMTVFPPFFVIRLLKK